jgi:hypothetical protein
MKKIVWFVVVISLLGMNGCGVSKQDYETLKAERDELLNELDSYKNGEPRLLALIEQSIEKGDISSARENITLLNKYHPESMNRPEVKSLVTIIETEEAKIVRLAAEKEAAIRAERLKKQQGFENTYAADAKVLDVAEADLMESNKTLTIRGYYIIRGYFDGESGGSIRIGSTRKRYSDGSYYVSGASVRINSDQLLKLTIGTSISVLVQAFEGHLVINPESKVQGFSLIEMQKN